MVATPHLLALGCVLIVLLGGCGGHGGADGESSGSVCQEAVSGRVTLPRDDARHREETEWWYWTGHLETAEGRYFGFQWAFFLASSPASPGQMVHHAITDLEDGSFHHTASVIWDPPQSVTDGFELEVGGQRGEGGDGHDVLHGEVDGYVLDLTVDVVKRPVLQHGDGYVDYSFGGYTYYYSRERMAASGTLALPDSTVLEVRGTAWFDHQWGSLSQAVDLGWDWFGIQLDDAREAMVFVVRGPRGELLRGGSLTDAGCRTREIGPDDLQVTAKGTWTSPHGGAVYPAGWTLRIFDETFEIEPVMAAQEVDGLLFRYWEGAATVTGSASGRAYVELTGY